MSSTQCIKTGARILVNNEVCYGDLFMTAEGRYILRCVDSWPVGQGVISSLVFHARFPNYDMWWDQSCEARPSTILLRAPSWFNYEGLPFEDFYL